MKRTTTTKTFVITVGTALALGIALALTLALNTHVASVSASDVSSGDLVIEKECLNNNPYCTIISSNLPEIIPPNVTNVEYGPAASDTGPKGVTDIGFDTNAVIYVGNLDWAVGRCTLGSTGLDGLCTFWDGTGPLAGFHARVNVTSTDGIHYYWNGKYWFVPVP